MEIFANEAFATCRRQRFSSTTGGGGGGGNQCSVHVLVCVRFTDAGHDMVSLKVAEESFSVVPDRAPAFISLKDDVDDINNRW